MLHPLTECPRHLQKRGGVLHAAAGQGSREFRQGRERLSQRLIGPTARRAPREFMHMSMKIPGFCWRTYCHATGLRLLLWIPMFLGRQ